MKSKVFCIGFHKTGTSSMASALKQLGYKVTGPDGVNDPDIEKNAITMAFNLAKHFDAFQDNPWPILFKELDAEFPDSKFILTLRSTDSWMKSQLNHFGVKETPMRQWIYGVGCPEGNEDIYLARFKHHNEEVVEYFKDRPSDLLILDLPRGDGWEMLCPFLGVDIPAKPFPHTNKGDYKGSIIKNFIKRITGRFA